MPIICFFGPDASGKTTLARELACKLSNEGHKVRLSWMRGYAHLWPDPPSAPEARLYSKRPYRPEIFEILEWLIL
ncbi:MAG: hypothetical protein QXI56_04240 [Candidatus Bathyarchaeia archaeon]